MIEVVDIEMVKTFITKCVMAQYIIGRVNGNDEIVLELMKIG